MKRRILPTGTVICGIAAVEQIGYEFSVRGIRRITAVSDSKLLNKSRTLLSDMEPDPGTDIRIIRSDEDPPEDTEGLILMGSAPIPETKKRCPVLRIPLVPDDLSSRLPGTDILVLDRRFFRREGLLDQFLKELYRESLSEESSYPFPLQFPGIFQFSADTELIWGDGTLTELGELLSRDKVRAPMLVTDRGIVAAGLLKGLLDSLDPGLDIIVRDNVPPDSDLQLIGSLTEDYRAYRRDGIIAMGGGSVLDTAKGMIINLGLRGKNILAMEGSNLLSPSPVPVYMIPTTSGTGSEATRVAVIADHNKKRKRLFVSQFLQPRTAILDSSLTLSLPPYLTSITGMDAMSHAVEAFTCLGKNPLSDLMAWRAMELLSAHMEQAVTFPAQAVHRRGMALASNLAGRAFSNSMVGMVHTIGHAIGGVCGAPHGSCMAVLLPFALEYNGESITEALGKLLVPLKGIDSYEHTAASSRGPAVIRHIRELNRSLHTATGGRHPCSLKEIAVKPSDFKAIAEAALGDASLMYNPRELRYGDIIEILKEAY